MSGRGGGGPSLLTGIMALALLAWFLGDFDSFTRVFETLASRFVEISTEAGHWIESKVASS